MKTQTAEEILEKNNIEITHWVKPRIIKAMNDHTTTQIEALRERLIRNSPSVLASASIDQTINEFLKEIND